MQAPQLCRATLPAQPLRRHRHRPLPPCADASLLQSVDTALFGSPAQAALALGAAALAVRTAVYFRLEAVKVAHLNRVPAPGARVLQYGVGRGKDLYYLPAGTSSVHCVDADADLGLLVQVGTAAGLPAVSLQKSALTAPLAGSSAGAYDAAVSADALGQAGASQAELVAALAEAARVLKPGAPFLFFEGGAGGAALLEALRVSYETTGLWAEVSCDAKWLDQPLSPHAIGAAVRSDRPAGTASASGEGAGRAAAAAAFRARSGKEGGLKEGKGFKR